MFSTGQLIFAVLFAVSFIIIIIFSYKKDKKQHAKNFKGARWVALGFALFIALLFGIKYFLKH